MPSWRTDWYPNVVAAFRSLRGDSTVGSDGVTMPLLVAADGIPLLSMVSDGLVSALRRLSKENKNPGTAARADLLDSDYLLDPATVIEGALSGKTDALYISLESYVAGIGQPGAAWMRSTTIGGTLYAPYLNDSFWGAEEYDLMSFARQAMVPWQGAADAAALMLSRAATAGDIADKGAVSALLANLRKLCSQLDILQENPPTSTFDKVKGAARNALTATEQFAGKAAAQLAEEVGTLAGNVAHGFFEQAGITSLIVAGIAISLIVR
jgi:hypothetical protein